MTIGAVLIAGLVSIQAPSSQVYEIQPGPAGQAINRLAAQAGIDVVVATDLRGRRSEGLSGRMPPGTALHRLLTPMGLRAVRIGEGMYRVEPAPARSAPRPPRVEPPPPTMLGEVLVTAAPPVGLSGASGRRLLESQSLLRAEGSAASDAIADLSATVDSTRQGTGRNKLFVRGLADSAMNGPLQATVGQYLGDLRLNYGSPDPDLTLIDIGRVEVFEGPQGTRFGAGSIGGVLRLHPNPPRLEETSARYLIGASATAGGAEGGEFGLVANRPIGERAAVRVLGYARRDGGFLAMPELGVREADTVDTVGGRLILRWTNGAWTVDLLAQAQSVSAGDGQAVPSGTSPQARATRVLEPYTSALMLGGITAQRRFGPVQMTTATSVTQQRLDERFDASHGSGPDPVVVDRRQITTTATSEVRLNAALANDWTLSGGAALTFGKTQVERRRRALNGGATDPSGADLSRTFAEAAAFGEAAFSPAPDWRAAIGTRISVVRADSDVQLLEPGRLSAEDRTGATVRVTPSLSIRWDPAEAFTLFGRLEQAVRPAGANEVGGAFARYQGDQVTLFEVGVRTRDWRDDLSGEASIGWIDWRDVQADIASPGGDLVTDNVGDGHIRFLSLKAEWRPTASLNLSASLFVNDSQLTRTRPSVIGGGRTDIPNVAPLGAQVSLTQDWGQIAGVPLSVGADFRYVGQSRLGVGPGLDVPHGGYLRSEFTARLGSEAQGLTLRVSNPFGDTGIRYGIGSPYQLSDPHIIPVRPMTIRLTLDRTF